MTDELELYEDKSLAFNGRKAKATDEEITKALAPVPIAFPQVKADDEWLNLHCMMLRDLDPNVLARAVRAAIATSDFPPTIAAIRKHAEGEQRPPGPRNDVDPRTLPDIPQRMFRLPEEEDRRARMAQLRRTEKWDRYYD